MMHLGKAEEETEDPIEKALEHFGTWQVLLGCLLFLYNMTYIFQLVMDEYQAQLFGDVHCAKPENLSVSRSKWLEISGHYKLNEAGVRIYDPCLIKDVNFSGIVPNDPKTWHKSENTIKCTSWEYEDNSSILYEWKLACKWPPVETFPALMFAGGGILGGSVVGYFIDRKGRRPYILWSIILNGIISYLTALSPYYAVYLFLRCSQGFLTIGVLPAITLLSMEVSGGRWIGILGSIYMFSFPIGYLLYAALSFQLLNWRYLHYGATVLSVFLLTGWWWLWVHKECDRLLYLIEDVLYINGIPVIDHRITQSLRTTGPMILSEKEMEVNLTDLVKTHCMRKRTFVCAPLFFCAYFAYYGVLLRLTQIYDPHQIYVAHLYSGMTAFLATAVSLSTVSKTWINDSMVLFFSNMISGIIFLFVNALDKQSPVITYLLVGSKFFMSIVNCHLMTYVATIYPTNIRGIGLCFFHLFSFLALSVIANGMTLEELKEGLMLFLMGMSGVIAGFLVLLLPLPHEGGLQDTIQQVEDPYVGKMRRLRLDETSTRMVSIEMDRNLPNSSQTLLD